MENQTAKHIMDEMGPGSLMQNNTYVNDTLCSRVPERIELVPWRSAMTAFLSTWQMLWNM
jgi:hypothetical protein